LILLIELHERLLKIVARVEPRDLGSVATREEEGGHHKASGGHRDQGAREGQDPPRGSPIGSPIGSLSVKFTLAGGPRGDRRNEADIASQGPAGDAGCEAIGHLDLWTRDEPLPEGLLLLDRLTAGRAVHQVASYGATNAVSDLVVNEGRNKRKNDLALNR